MTKTEFDLRLDAEESGFRQGKKGEMYKAIFLHFFRDAVVSVKRVYVGEDYRLNDKTAIICIKDAFQRTFASLRGYEPRFPTKKDEFMYEFYMELRVKLSDEIRQKQPLEGANPSAVKNANKMLADELGAIIQERIVAKYGQ